MIPRALAGLSVSALLAAGLVTGPVSAAEPLRSDSASAPSVSAFASASHPKWGHVMGIADLNEMPVRNGRVTVRTLTGQRLAVRGPLRRTGRTGVFHVQVRHLPEFFLVEVRDGRFGHRSMGGRVLRSIGWARERGEVVNQASTIAAYNLTTHSRAQLRQHPKRLTHKATRQTARLLGLHNPRHRFSLGLAGRTRSVAYDPGRAFGHAQRHGFNRTLKRLGRQASLGVGHRDFAPRHYLGASPLGSRSKSKSQALGVAPACEGVTDCLLVVLKNTAVSLVGSGVQAGICKTTSGVPVVASLTGCGTSQDISQILSLLNAMNEQITNLEAQMTEVLAMLAQGGQTAAFNNSGLKQLDGVYEAWLMDLLELSDPAVTVQPLSVLPAASSVAQICTAAYTTSAQIPDPYDGYSFTQTPYAACQDAGNNTGDYLGATPTGAWATSIFQALTGYGPGYAPDDLLAPTYQTGVSAGGTKMITGADQNTLNQLLSSFVGMQAAAYQSALAWQTFESAWTGQQVTCPNTPLPSQFTNPENQPLSMTGPCATTVTALFETSVEAYIMQNLGPRSVLPAATVLDTYNSVGAADVPVWWSAAVDVTAASWYGGGNEYYPYAPTDVTDYVPVSQSPLATPTTPVPVVTTSSDTFTFGNTSQLMTLANHAMSASTQKSINPALNDVGFEGPGSWIYMAYTYLVTDVQRMGFQTECTMDHCPPPYGVASCGASYLQPGTIPAGSGSVYDCYPDQERVGLVFAGVYGTYGGTYLALDNNVVTTKTCGLAAGWSPPSLPQPSGQSPWCTPPQNVEDPDDDSYYGLLLDTTPGDVLWSNTPFQQWQNSTIPVIASN